MISIAIIDDHAVVLEGIYHYLKEQGFGKVDVFTDSESLDAAVKETTYDLYIIDVELKNETGLDIIGKLREANAQAKIIVYTMHEEIWMVRKIQEKDVDGVLYKSNNMEQIMEAINAVLEGKKFFSDKFKRKMRRNITGPIVLSKRENDILNKIARGYSSRDIAGLLFISENTVETHRRSLFAKLNANNMADLIVKAIAQGLLDVNEISKGNL